MKLKTILTICILALFVGTSFSQINENSSLEELEELAIAYYRNNNADSAIIVIKHALEIFPDREDRLTGFLGAIYTYAGRFPEAIKTWEDGMTKGYNYELNNDKYKNLFKDDAEFARLIKIETDRLDASHLEKEVVLPLNYNSDKHYPVLFVFHGNSRNIESAKLSWKSKVLSDQFITVFLQSYFPANNTNFKWVPNDPKIEKEFKVIYDQIMTTYPIDKNRIIFSAMSAGGIPAINFAMNEFVPMTGLILNCPVIPADIEGSKIQLFVEQHKKLAIITGETDFALEAQQKLVGQIRQLNGQTQIVVIKDLGHEFSEDFSNLLDKYLLWIIK